MRGNRYHPTRKVNPYRRGKVDYNYMKTAERSFRQDNDMTKYDDEDYKKMRGRRKYLPYYSGNETLEESLTRAIKKAFDAWNNPFYCEVINPEAEIWEQKYKHVPDYDIEEGDYPSIRELLAQEDSKFDRNDRFQRIRVPSMKRSNKEWEKFYRVWPSIACEVAVGKRRFIDGAKLKYIPLFKNILDKEWPVDAKRSYNLFK